MNRRDVFGAAGVAAIAHFIPTTAASMRAAGLDQTAEFIDQHTRERSLQWTGYHWAEVTDGTITRVHNGDEWFLIDAFRSELPVCKPN